MEGCGGREVWLGRTERPFAFHSPFPGAGFALLLVVGSQDVTSDEQSELSEQFVRQGCRYVVCWGHRCSTWDDSIDMVGVTDPVPGRPEGPFVMTTWHEHEPIDEAACFFAANTSFDDFAADQFAVLIVGGQQHLEAQVRAVVQRAFRP